MNYKYHMPTKVYSGKQCIRNNSTLLKEYGSKAMIVTGRSSAKKNGALDDVTAALDNEQISYVIFDKVMSNPTIAVCYEGAGFAKQNNVDFIIAIGGGSPLDAAKVMGLLARQDIAENDLFSGAYSADVLPLIAVPTTAGTGSEVTQYAILTNDSVESKTSVATDFIFPKIAFLDSSYMKNMPVVTTINTAIDALSHALEGMLTVRANLVSNTLAKESMRFFIECVPALDEAAGKKPAEAFDEKVREKLTQCSLLAGMVIAQTGTTIVHHMGYSLTYFKDIDHGRANGLLLAEYLRLVEKYAPALAAEILAAMSLNTVNELKDILTSLLGEKDTITTRDIDLFSSKPVDAKKLSNCTIKPTQEEIRAMYTASLIQNQADQLC